MILSLSLKFNNKICSRHDIAEILLMLALNTDQSINQSINQSFDICNKNKCKLTYVLPAI